jgi:CO/xanthine dehydrogenase Mo-binding subunit
LSQRIEPAARPSGWSSWASGGDRGRGIGFARYQSGAYCAAVADVAVDHRVQVRTLTVAVDVGAEVNPDGVVNQIEGGAVQAALGVRVRDLPLTPESIITAIERDEQQGSRG